MSIKKYPKMLNKISKSFLIEISLFVIIVIYLFVLFSKNNLYIGEGGIQTIPKGYSSDHMHPKNTE